MTHINDAYDRRAFINGLRDLANYLEDHPELPHPGYVTAIDVFPEGDTDTERRNGVNQLAEHLGVIPTDRRGHYRAIRTFGPITYCAVAISDQARAIHDANYSYHGCITPDSTTGDLNNDDAFVSCPECSNTDFAETTTTDYGVARFALQCTNDECGVLIYQ